MPSDKSLVKAMNGVPAQTYHPDAASYQETHGSNNAPHMKVTDPDTGEPIDPREVSNLPSDYPDSAALAELQALKSDIAETKQTQADILEKLNGTLDTQLSGSNVEDGLPTTQTNRRIGKETLTYQRSGVITGGASETLVDLPNQECNLLSLSLGTNYQSMQIRISFYKENGDLDGNLKIADSSGSQTHHPYPHVVNRHSDGENDFWTLRVFNEETDEYVLTMRRELKCLNGVKITIHNFSDSKKNVAINSAIATWEVGK